MEEDDIPTFAKRIKEKYPEYAQVDDTDLVERIVRKHPIYASQVKLPDGFKLLTTSSGYPELDKLYEQAGREHNVNPDLLLEQGRKETSFKPDVMYGRVGSSAGAKGSGQFMPATAERFKVDVNDPRSGINGQAQYMRKLLDMFDNDEALALAAYNSGEGNVQKYGNKVPPFAETQDYVKKITGNLEKVRKNASPLRSFVAEQKPPFDPKQLQGTQLPPTNPTGVALQSGVPQQPVTPPVQTVGGTENVAPPPVAPVVTATKPSTKIVPSSNPLIQQARERMAQKTQPLEEEPIRIDAIPARTRTVDAVTPQNEDNALIGTVNVGQAKGREAAELALKQLAPQYNLNFDEILKANPNLSITPNKTGNVDVTVGDLKAMGVDTRPILAQRAVEQRVENPQVDTNLQVFKPTSDPTLDQARQNVFNDPLSKGTDEEIQAEYDRLNLPQEQRDNLEAWGRGLADAERASGTGGFTSQFLTTFGSDIANMVSGARRFDPVSRVGDALVNWASGGVNPIDPRNLDKLAQKFQVIGESSKGDSLLMNTSGQLAGGLPGLVGATALAGGNPILGFGLHSLLTNSGEPSGTQIKEVTKNTILGAIFSGAGQLGKTVADATAKQFLPKAMQEALENPNIENAIAENIRNRGLNIAKLAEEGATAGERTAAQKQLERFFEKNGLTMEDLTAPAIRRNPLFDAAVRREIAIKTALETGTRAVTVGSVGVATGLAEGQPLSEALKQGGMWAAMELVMGILHKKPNDKLTPEDIERVNGSVVKVPDPENPKQTKDILFIGDGEKLKAKDVTGKVPPNAVDVQSLPKNDWNKNIEDIVAKEGATPEQTPEGAFEPPVVPRETKTKAEQEAAIKESSEEVAKQAVEEIETQRKTELKDYYKQNTSIPLDVDAKIAKKLEGTKIEIPRYKADGTPTKPKVVDAAKYQTELQTKHKILQDLIDCIHG